VLAEQLKYLSSGFRYFMVSSPKNIVPDVSDRLNCDLEIIKN
jgi:hypothetical protein